MKLMFDWGRRSCLKGPPTACLISLVWKPNVATFRLDWKLHAVSGNQFSRAIMLSLQTQVHYIHSPTDWPPVKTSVALPSLVSIPCLIRALVFSCASRSARAPQEEWWHTRTNNKPGYAHRTLRGACHTGKLQKTTKPPADNPTPRCPNTSK